MHGDEIGRMWFRRVYITAMRGGNKDRTTGVSSLANEEPVVVVKAGIDIVREVVGEDRGDGRGSMVREGKTPLRRSRCRSICKGTSGAEDRDVGCDRGVGSHQGSEVFAARRSDKHVVGIDGDIFMKWGEEESVEYLLRDLGGSGRHR